MNGMGTIQPRLSTFGNMFHLSETDRIKAEADALRTLTINDNSILADRLSTREKKKGVNFGLDVHRTGARISPGSRARTATAAIKTPQNDIFPSGEYKISIDM